MPFALAVQAIRGDPLAPTRLHFDGIGDEDASPQCHDVPDCGSRSICWTAELAFVQVRRVFCGVSIDPVWLHSTCCRWGAYRTVAGTTLLQQQFADHDLVIFAAVLLNISLHVWSDWDTGIALERVWKSGRGFAGQFGAE